MNAKHIRGKRIKSVRHVRLQCSSGDWMHSVDAIVLEDGTELRPLAVELESGDGYGIQIIVVRSRRT